MSTPIVDGSESEPARNSQTLVDNVDGTGPGAHPSLPDIAHPKHGRMWALMLGAIGVVYGDIGTSPLYTMSTIFTLNTHTLNVTPANVYGIISLIFWSVFVVVSLKYVLFVLRADNHGEGGVMALAALTRTAWAGKAKVGAAAMILGVIGAALFYGDSVITPAITVLSAVEGLAIPAPALAEWALPIGAVVIVALFAVQRFGTHFVGRAFGPVMVLWFSSLAALGILQIIKQPAALQALSPHYALAFVISKPAAAFLAMGGVVLAITGAEALYADMGHFGRKPIARVWFFFVWPALTLNYVGQGVMILNDPAKLKSPVMQMTPDALQWPMLILATAATVIASQSVISGAYSVSREAERLGYLPRLTFKHTSKEERGQIYVPSINWMLCIGVLVLMFSFKHSEHLAHAYGLAVTATLVITSVLLLVFARRAWRWGWPAIIALGLVFLAVEGSFLGANLTKIAHGGWLPIVMAGSVAFLMFTWNKGRHALTEERNSAEGAIEPFIDWLHTDPVTKVPGTAVFLHPNKDTTPLALRQNALVNHVIHENVVIVTLQTATVPYVPDSERVVVDHLGDPYDAITHVTLVYGYLDDQNVPQALRLAQDMGVDMDLDEAYYYLSKIQIHREGDSDMNRLQKNVFLSLTKQSADPTLYFRLPQDRVVVTGGRLDI